VAGAEEASLKDDELVGVVLAVAILLAAARSTLSFVREERRKKFEAGVVSRTEGALEQTSGQNKAQYTLDCVKKERERFDSERTLLDFCILFVSIASRIALSTTVQLLASAARGRQTTRAARVLTLVSLSSFFVWIESSASSSAF
jgi:Tfp pilus assembly protein PilE